MIVSFKPTKTNGQHQSIYTKVLHQYVWIN